MSKQIILKHLNKGGTGLTNFNIAKLPIYAEAIRQFGSEDFAVTNISFWPAPPEYGGSLHYFGPKQDLGPFWRVFEMVEVEFEDTARYKEAGRITQELINRLTKKD